MNQWIFSNYEIAHELLWPVRTQWYNLGIALKINRDKLESIKKSNLSNCDDCFNAMLKSCSEINLSITWTDVCEVLGRQTVDRKEVAESIRQYFR